ncbi:MAG: DUF3106 domain-containing protein [Gallionella sp.]|nr:DUF3106 domain-containing protein [Gallionella sp.]
MNKLPDINAPTKTTTIGRQLDIPALSGKHTVRHTGMQVVIARLPMLIAAFAVCFSLNTAVADTPASMGAQSAVTPGTDAEQREEMRAHWEKMSPEERKQIRARMQEHWKSMTPEQREKQREEMRQNFKNMSPQERQKFKSDMDMIDGMHLPERDYPPRKTVATGSSAKG